MTTSPRTAISMPSLAPSTLPKVSADSTALSTWSCPLRMTTVPPSTACIQVCAWPYINLAQASEGLHRQVRRLPQGLREHFTRRRYARQVHPTARSSKRATHNCDVPTDDGQGLP